MGGFLLIDKNKSGDIPDTDTRIASKLGLGKASKFDFGQYELTLFKKGLVDVDNFYRNEIASIYCVGTMVYKRSDARGSMVKLLEDLAENKFDFDEIYGTNIVFYEIRGQFFYLTDGTDIYNVYHDVKKNIYSSSLLLLLYSGTNRYKFNKNALTEILTTGFLIGPETVFEGIYRLEGNEGIKHLNHSTFNFPQTNSIKNFDEGIEQQLEILKKYFNSIKNFVDQNGIDTGLTGGFDSRLVLALAEKSFENISVHSHWKKRKTKELICAERVADVYKLDLKSPVILLSNEMTDDELCKLLKKSFYFCDGHFRMYSYWSEYQNTQEYRERVLGKIRLGMNGIGGEQYRNNNLMLRKKWSIDDWVKYEVVKQPGGLFESKCDEENFLGYLKQKVTQKLNMGSKNVLTLEDLKRYNNEVYIPAGRGQRSSRENKITYYLSPFTEYKVSRKAYDIIPFLGSSYKFQMEMLRRIAPELNNVELDYGFKVNDGVPLKELFQAYIKESLPMPLFYRLKHLVSTSSTRNAALNLRINSKYADSLFQRVSDLGLGVNLNVLERFSSIGLLIIDLGFFISELEDKIIFER